MANYLQIEFSTGRIFEGSKTEKEGFEPFTNTKGNVSYRKYLNKGLYGTVEAISVRDSQIGDQISVKVVDENKVVNYLQMPLFDAKNQISTYAEAFIINLKSLVLGKDYRIFPYSIVDENNERNVNRGISIKEADLSKLEVFGDSLVKYGYSYKTKDGQEVIKEIPAVEWTKKVGKNVLNRDAKDEFLYNVLMGAVGQPAPSEQKPTPTKEKVEPQMPPAPDFSNEDEDNLPF